MSITQFYKQYISAPLPKSRVFKYILIVVGAFGFWGIRNLSLKIYNKAKGYPDGPKGLPFIGCFFSFGMRPRKFLFNIATKYGPITFVPLLAVNNLYISDPKMLIRLYSNEKIVDRPHFKNGLGSTLSFFSLNDEEWIKRRRFASTTFVNIADTTFVLERATECFKYIEPEMNDKYVKNKELWYPIRYVEYISFNSTWSALFGVVLPFNDPFITKVCDAVNEFVNNAQKVFLLNFSIGKMIQFPQWFMWNLHWYKDEKLINLLLKWMNDNLNIIVDVKNNKIKTSKPSNVVNNNNKSLNTNIYSDFMIEKQQNNEIKTDQMMVDMRSVCVGGIDGPSRVSEYGFLLLAKYPNIQDIVYNELVKVIKENNAKTFNFKILNKTHLFRAFIYETLRISCVGPLGIPHATTKRHKLRINGKDVIIPEDTVLHSNTYFMLKHLDWNNNNKVLKEENNSIHLEYWLDPITQKFKINENFILFGAGRRDCVGRALAIKSISAIIALLVTKYKFVSPTKDPINLKIQQKWGVGLQIKPAVGIYVEKR